MPTYALLADVDTSLGLAVVSMISTVAAGAFAYLSSRDKIRFDSAKLGLEKDVKALQDRLTTSETDRRSITERLVKVEGEYAECKEDRTRLHMSIHNQKVEIAVLRAQFDGTLSADQKLPTDIADAAT